MARGYIAPDTGPTAVVLLGAMRGVMQQWLVDDRIRLVAARDRLLHITELVLRRECVGAGVAEFRAVLGAKFGCSPRGISVRRY